MDQHQHPQGLLTSIFGGKPVPSGEMFTHPNEEAILTSAIANLQKSETGRHLLGVLRANKVGVRVIKNRNAHGYSPSKTMVYLGAPPQQTKADPLTTIEFAAAIREIEQEVMGYTLPNEDADPLEAASARHAKTLDIVSYMCKVSLELEVEFSDTSYVGTMESLGFDEAIKMYLSQVDDPAIIDAYEKAQRVQ